MSDPPALAPPGHQAGDRGPTGQTHRRRPRPHSRANHPLPTTSTTADPATRTAGTVPPEGVLWGVPPTDGQQPRPAPSQTQTQTQTQTQNERGGRAPSAGAPALLAPPSTAQLSGLHASFSALQLPDGQDQATENDAGHRRPRRRRARKQHEATEGAAAADPDETSHPPAVAAPRNDRRSKFGAALTAPSDPSFPPANPNPNASNNAHRAHPPPPSANADLTTRLTYQLSHPPYADCPICFSPLHPAQPIWCCTPNPPNPGSVGSSTSTSNNSNCWTAFHLRCIREWASKSVRETRDAWAARGEDRPGEWRCPGCQTRRSTVPREYRCFCGRAAAPSGGRMSTPHGCGEKCARPRPACAHACPLLCHPGPCPPCVVTVHRACYCGKKTLALRCSSLTGAHPPELTCAEVCGKTLGCGKHACERECHPGACAPCEVRELVRCYCGKESRDVACGEGAVKVCADPEKHERWEGRYACAEPCNRPFRCGVHRCASPCHPPPATPPPCPTDPELVSTCPCTQTPLSALPHGARTKCTDPVPTCGKVCSRPLEACEHVCPRLCHAGPCAPCAVPLALSCRCGETVRTVPCSTATSTTNASANADILCDRPCRALRHCGRHVCARVCCPLAWQGKVAKGKRRALEQALLGRPEEDPDGWHDCDLVCGKLLACRNHHCTLPDHRGACPTCLQSSFDELVCACRRTVLMPPIPCGTVLDCPFPCSRPPPACGHPPTQHTCHEAGECPPCPFLTTKRCACGKSLVPNVRCSQEKVGCGAVCARLLDCGFHSCDRLCHAGQCEPCAQVCAKPRKLCAHPCPVQCHAPSACPEDEPCPARVTLTCACGRIKQQALCGACTAAPASRSSTQLKCGQECAIAKRNARLAEALGIPEGTKSKLGATEWPERLVTFFRENRDWAGMAERNLNEFVQGPKKTQVLPQMVLARQRFMHEMANVYRLDVDYVDSGANRSVQLVRRLDSRIPTPMLSEVAAPPPPPTRQAGSGLVSLNRPKPAATPVARAWGTSTPKPASAAAVVAAPPPPPAVPLSAWDAPTPRPMAPASAILRTTTPVASSSHVPVLPVPLQPSEPVRESWDDD
ncbi:hypothetical protein CALCODRAFT_511711 [Calocera cornea HHB12733]|uniref:NF-X1-type domain-containing protein n=1 Tax=Calocera cornea HHB12733 TaxID=1353952 RepID=A0A165DK97_9BASI|nr:hypothetical protein CALCODRAFT_511711 [Calocera cornea HHB12733]